jgi:hypothetical protein
MTPYTPRALLSGVRWYLEPYGFYGFTTHRLEAEDIIEVRMTWWSGRYVAAFSGLVATDPPWQTSDPVGAWIESQSRAILNATWGTK